MKDPLRPLGCLPGPLFALGDLGLVLRYFGLKISSHCTTPRNTTFDGTLVFDRSEKMAGLRRFCSSVANPPLSLPDRFEGDAVAAGAGAQPGHHLALHRKLELVSGCLEGRAEAFFQRRGERRAMLREYGDLVGALYLRGEGREGRFADLQRRLDVLAFGQVFRPTRR